MNHRIVYVNYSVFSTFISKKKKKRTRNDNLYKYLTRRKVSTQYRRICSQLEVMVLYGCVCIPLSNGKVRIHRQRSNAGA